MSLKDYGCIQLYTCTHVCTHTHTHTHTHTQAHTDAHTHACACTRTHACTHTHTEFCTLPCVEEKTHLLLSIDNHLVMRSFTPCSPLPLRLTLCSFSEIFSLFLWWTAELLLCVFHFAAVMCVYEGVLKQCRAVERCSLRTEGKLRLSDPPRQAYQMRLLRCVCGSSQEEHKLIRGWGPGFRIVHWLKHWVGVWDGGRGI